MTVAAGRSRAWSEFGVNRHGWVTSGVFQVGSADYECEFRSGDELGRFLDFLMASPAKPSTSRLYLHQSVVPVRPEHHLSTLRFQFDTERQVAAAVLLLIDRNHDGTLMAWMTHGDAPDTEADLAHDSWNEHETLFPPKSFITLSQLRAAVLGWAFGESVPPGAVSWSEVSGIGWL